MSCFIRIYFWKKRFFECCPWANHSFWHFDCYQNCIVTVCWLNVFIKNTANALSVALQWELPCWRTASYFSGYGDLLPAARSSSRLLPDFAQEWLEICPHRGHVGIHLSKWSFASCPLWERDVLDRGNTGWEALTSYSSLMQGNG